MTDPQLDPDAIARMDQLDKFKRATRTMPGEPFTTWRGDVVVDTVEESALPYHLRMDAPALAACTECGRKTWEVDQIGRVCGMTQPNGSTCMSTFPYATA